MHRLYCFSALMVAVPKELLRPEEVVNPVLHRFHACIAKKLVEGAEAAVSVSIGVPALEQVYTPLLP